jgi:sulfatase maturation enzyme AslB (radical SAM superfamily)
MSIAKKISTKIKNKNFLALLKIANFLRYSSLTKIKGNKKKYPKVIQLPITYQCNSRCIMCNIWKMDYSNEAKINEFAEFMKDPLFKKVEDVGINGGEPSLVVNLPLYATEILKLPSLKSLNIISHGFSPKLLLPTLENIYKQCKEKNIPFHVSISLDGTEDIHNTVRGSKVYDKTFSTILEIQNNKNKYCDSMNVGCTVMQQNINDLAAFESLIKKHNINIKYRLGIDNKRIDNHNLKKGYSLMYSPLKQNAIEFFHSQLFKQKKMSAMFKYYSIFYWLKNKKPKRLLGCMWKEEGVTVDSRGDMYYCAVASDKIGSLRKEKGENIFFSDKNIKYREEIIKNECDNCIHDYSGKPELPNVLIFIKSMFKDRFALKWYRIKSFFII